MTPRQPTLPRLWLVTDARNDAVLDRASEAIVLGGAAWYFGERGEYVQAGVTYAAVLGSVAVSYMRARAEINGLEMREGIFRRQERVAVLGLGLLTGWLAAAMWILAVLSNLTAVQRFWLIVRGLRVGPQPPATSSEFAGEGERRS